VDVDPDEDTGRIRGAVAAARVLDPAQTRPRRSIPDPRPIDTHGPARILALCNQKGGVGKTTSTINLGAALTEHGRKVLLVDFILIDCQPSLGLLTVNALTAADAVIIPLECEFFSLRGVALLIDTIDKIRERLNPRLHVEGILATMYDSRTVHGREVFARVVE